MVFNILSLYLRYSKLLGLIAALRISFSTANIGLLVDSMGSNPLYCSIPVYGILFI